ncbi:MAG: hypothetical protein OER04_18865 [Cyclobacteriaceae bacterium]|nr:hypothetical protein [Cyclobacteriaceae bacterium]
MKILKSLNLIINYRTVIVTLLSLAATWLCLRFNYTANFPLTLIGIAIVFPIVFSINSAYRRRESALQHLSDFKMHGLAIYFAGRDWIDSQSLATEIKDTLQNLFQQMSDLMHSKKVDVQKEQRVHYAFSQLSELLQKFRDTGLAGGEISRISQYLSKMMIAFDKMKIILHYRTPITLRAYNKVFIYTFPIIYGPYFAYTFESYSGGLGYMMPIMFSFIMVSLDNIQDHLENPYDLVGEDDVKLEVEEYMRYLKY